MNFFALIVILCVKVELFPVAFPVTSKMKNDTLQISVDNILFRENLETMDISSDSTSITATPRDFIVDSDVSRNKTAAAVIMAEEEDGSTKSNELLNSENRIATSCVSQATMEYINNPCSRQIEERRSRKCNINDIYHLKQEAQNLRQTMKNELASDYDLEISKLQLYPLNKTMDPNSQLQELEKSLQIYFLYLSEADSIYSTLELSVGTFIRVRRLLLSILCSLDNGTPSVLQMTTGCLSTKLPVFFPQIDFILKSLHADLQVAMTWKNCQTSE